MVEGSFFTAMSEAYPDFGKRPGLGKSPKLIYSGDLCKVVSGRKIPKGTVVTVKKIKWNDFAYSQSSEAHDVAFKCEMMFEAHGYDVESEAQFNPNSSVLVELSDYTCVWTYLRNLEQCR